MGHVASRLRPADEAEVRAATGRSPREIVPLSFSLSRQCFTIRYTDGVTQSEPLALFGVTDDPNSQRGVVWLLGTPGIVRVHLALLDVAPTWLDYLSHDYPDGLHNVVDARNTLHLRWLQRTGFTLGAQYVLNDHRFIHVHRKAP